MHPDFITFLLRVLNAEDLRSSSLLASQDITVSLYKVRACSYEPFEQGSLGAAGVFGVVAEYGRALGSTLHPKCLDSILTS